MHSLVQQIIRNCKENTEKVALKGDGIEVSYGELFDLAKSYAKSIKDEDLRSNWIGVDTTLGWKCYAAIFGCWLAGKGYLPINFSFPKNRIQSVIKSSGLEAVISNSPLMDLILITPKPCFEFKEASAEWSYLLYTSGTTGAPKGVPIKMRNLEAFVNHYQIHETIDFNSSDIFLQSYELTFDVSIFCFLMAFVNGATLVLPNSNKTKQLSLFKAMLDYEVTVASFVPSVIRLTKDFLPRVQFPQLRYSFFSGEVLMGKDAKVWMNSLPKAQVYNCYGPTETVIVCTEEHLNALDVSYFNNGLPLPLGKKFAEVELELVGGEVVFSGRQTFEGYLNNKVIDRFPSGDLAHFDSEGKLLFDGRKDNQIQWNGYRIELEEIENTLSKALGVWVKCIYLKSNQNLIVFSLEDDKLVSSKINEIFPNYYKPSKVMTVEKIPLNLNGKLDSGALLNIAESSF